MSFTLSFLYEVEARSIYDVNLFDLRQPIISQASLIEGDKHDNILQGTNQDDVILGGGCRDRLYGYKGNDTLIGGDDSDFLLGDGGNDVLMGGTGNDTIRGHYGNEESKIGEPGAFDRMIGGKGSDQFQVRSFYTDESYQRDLYPHTSYALIQDFSKSQGDHVDLNGEGLRSWGFHYTVSHVDLNGNGRRDTVIGDRINGGTIAVIRDASLTFGDGFLS